MNDAQKWNCWEMAEDVGRWCGVQGLRNRGRMAERDRESVCPPRGWMPASALWQCGGPVWEKKFFRGGYTAGA